MIHEIGLACLDPRCAGGRPRFLDRDDDNSAAQTATTRPTAPGKPFTRWSIRKLADHLSMNTARRVRIGQAALLCLPARQGISFQRTKTWKESQDQVDEFGLLGIRPTAGSCWAEQSRPGRLPAHPRITYFHGCYSGGDDQSGEPTGVAKVSTTPGLL